MARLPLAAAPGGRRFPTAGEGNGARSFASARSRAAKSDFNNLVWNRFPAVVRWQPARAAPGGRSWRHVSTGAILTKAVDLRGVYVGSVGDLHAALRSGIRPIIDEVFAFEHADAAFERRRSGAHRGKVVIEIAA